MSKPVCPVCNGEEWVLPVSEFDTVPCDECYVAWRAPVTDAMVARAAASLWDQEQMVLHESVIRQLIEAALGGKPQWAAKETQ